MNKLNYNVYQVTIKSTIIIFVIGFIILIIVEYYNSTI